MNKFKNIRFGYPKGRTYEFFFKRFVKPYVKKGVILDAGCGLGWFLQKLEKENIGSKLVLIGLDKNRKMLKEARTNLSKAHLVIADLHSLPFKDRMIDLIICNDVLEHLQEPQKSIQQFSNVLKRRGTLVIQTPNLLSFIYLFRYLAPNKIIKRFEGLFDIHPFKTYYRMNFPWKLRNILMLYGFDSISFQFFLLQDIFQLPFIPCLFLFLFDQGIRLLSIQRSRAQMVCVAQKLASYNY